VIRESIDVVLGRLPLQCLFVKILCGEPPMIEILVGKVGDDLRGRFLLIPILFEMFS
jgi:hypothetical protein